MLSIVNLSKYRVKRQERQKIYSSIFHLLSHSDIMIRFVDISFLISENKLPPGVSPFIITICRNLSELMLRRANSYPEEK